MASGSDPSEHWGGGDDEAELSSNRRRSRFSLFKRSSKASAPPKNQPRSIILAGATVNGNGISLAKFNGVYNISSRTHNKAPLYVADGGGEVHYIYRHVQGRWLVTDTESRLAHGKGKHRFLAYEHGTTHSNDAHPHARTRSLHAAQPDAQFLRPLPAAHV